MGVQDHLYRAEAQAGVAVGEVQVAAVHVEAVQFVALAPGGGDHDPVLGRRWRSSADCASVRSAEINPNRKIQAVEGPIGIDNADKIDPFYSLSSG